MNQILKKQFLLRFFAALDACQIMYFVMGEYKYLPLDTNGSDIDIVIINSSPSWLNKVVLRCVKENGVLMASYYRNPQAEFYRFITSDWGVQIDFLMGGLYYRGVQYYPTEKLKSHIKVYF